MHKWGVALATVGLLAMGARAADLKYVPVDTSRNLAAPVPYYGPVVQKKSYWGRISDTVKGLSPFHSKKGLATMPAPTMPTTAPISSLLGKAASLAGPTHGFSATAR